MTTEDGVLEDWDSDQAAPAVLERHAELEQLLSENSESQLINYVCSWVHSRADAKDIVQEAYYRIFRRRGDLAAVSHLRGYLYRTARNIALDWIRERIVREAFVEEQPLRAASAAPSSEQVLLAKEELETIHSAIEALPPKSKLAFLMIRVDGATYEEVAKKLGIKTHSARRLVERAVGYLLAAKQQTKRKARRKR